MPYRLSKPDQDPAGTSPLVTIRAGGTIGGIVTISAIPTVENMLTVEARWIKDGDTQSVTATLDGQQAQVLANDWANQLAIDREPTT